MILKIIFGSVKHFTPRFELLIVILPQIILHIVIFLPVSAAKRSAMMELRIRNSRIKKNHAIIIIQDTLQHKSD